MTNIETVLNILNSLLWSLLEVTRCWQYATRSAGMWAVQLLFPLLAMFGRGMPSDFAPNLTRFPFGVAGWSIGSKNDGGPPSRADDGGGRGPAHISVGCS
jgi:hypothetical protein